MAINLDIILKVEEAIDSSYIYIKDFTGTCNNDNGFQDTGGTCNTNNPLASEVDSITLQFTGGGLTSSVITLTPTQISEMMDPTTGTKLLASDIFGSTVTEFPYGAYSILVTYGGTSVSVPSQPVVFSEAETKYHALMEQLMEYVRSYNTNVSMPPQDSADWFNTVLNLGVINFLIDDVNYACEREMKEYADEIIESIDNIVSKSGQIVEFTTF